jgi:hypothetical protein
MAMVSKARGKNKKRFVGMKINNLFGRMVFGWIRSNNILFGIFVVVVVFFIQTFFFIEFFYKAHPKIQKIG